MHLDEVPERILEIHAQVFEVEGVREYGATAIVVTCCPAIESLLETPNSGAEDNRG
ncbi:MAG: hypothetical protein VX951_00405 [Planctomycetota bacterium]|nr:hypothetical protein [Planctomycetota bacterium]